MESVCNDLGMRFTLQRQIMIEEKSAFTALFFAVENKWLPVICGAVGYILGIMGVRAMPDFPAFA